jgi:ABC-type nitrate/sulfonate/bicarbonate transport system permease component
MHRALARAAVAVTSLLLWEVIARAAAPLASVVPPPSAILAQYWIDGDLYAGHVTATIRNAGLGFVIGNIIAIGAAVAFSRFPLLESIFLGVNITLFAIPPIVIGPILVLILQGGWPEILLAASIVYFPTMAATLVGLRAIDRSLVDLVAVYGGRENAVLRFIRLRAALPSLFAGLQVAASLAVLGAMLGEFGSGERWGLGTFLLASLGQVRPDRLWGISLAAAVIAGAGYGAFGIIGRRLLAASLPTTVATTLPDDIAAPRVGGVAQRIALVVTCCVVPLALWVLILKSARLSPIIAPGPIEIFTYLVTGARSSEARDALLAALGRTVPVAAAGMACGLAFAFVLAVGLVLVPRLMKAITPVAFFLQNTPLLALTPVILLAFGRGTTASLFMAILVVFFPAFVLVAHGLRAVPPAAIDLVRAYGATPAAQLMLVSIPYSVRFLFAAAKLVAPRALLGVMIAEWLLTGTGLGNLMDASRGVLDYEMVWSAALVSILVSIAAYEAMAMLERLVDFESSDR